MIRLNIEKGIPLHYTYRQVVEPNQLLSAAGVQAVATKPSPLFVIEGMADLPSRDPAALLPQLVVTILRSGHSVQTHDAHAVRCTVGIVSSISGIRHHVPRRIIAPCRTGNALQTMALCRVNIGLLQAIDLCREAIARCVVRIALDSGPCGRILERRKAS